MRKRETRASDGALSRTPPANAAGCRGRRYRLASAFPRRYLAAGVVSLSLSLLRFLFLSVSVSISIRLPLFFSLRGKLVHLCPFSGVARSSTLPSRPPTRGNRCWSGPELVQNRWARAGSASRGVSPPIHPLPATLLDRWRSRRKRKNRRVARVKSKEERENARGAVGRSRTVVDDEMAQRKRRIKRGRGSIGARVGNPGDERTRGRERCTRARRRGRRRPGRGTTLRRRRCIGSCTPATPGTSHVVGLPSTAIHGGQLLLLRLQVVHLRLRSSRSSSVSSCPAVASARGYCRRRRRRPPPSNTSSFSP